jgi:hypothetical protein
MTECSYNDNHSQKFSGLPCILVIKIETECKKYIPKLCLNVQ